MTRLLRLGVRGALMLTLVLAFLPAMPAGGQAGAVVSAEAPEAILPVTIAADTILTNDRVWLAANSVKVNSGVTLTIQPGTTIKFAAGRFLVIEGTLVADGAGGNPIAFTSAEENPAPGDWGGPYIYTIGGIFFTETSAPAVLDGTGAYISGSILRHAVVEYGMGISCVNAAPLIEDNLIAHNSGGSAAVSAIRLQAPTGSDPMPVIRQNLITDNAGALYMTAPVQVIANVITANEGADIWSPDGTDLAIYLYAAEVRDNSIYGNQVDYDLKFAASAGSSLDVSGNYWGTTEAAEIEERIYHGHDDFRLGMAVYAPFLTEPSPEAPPILAGVTAGAAGTVGLGEATFTLRFSAPMDQTAAPSVSFHSANRGEWTRYTRANSGLPANTVISITPDADGSVWIGTLGGGAAHFDGATWATFNTHNSGLGDNSVYAIASGGVDDQWFGFHRADGVVAGHRRGLEWANYACADCAEEDRLIVRDIRAFGDDPEIIEGLDEVYDIVVDSTGSVWFATKGVVEYVGATWTLHDLAMGLPDDWVNALAAGPNGVVWAAMENQGVARFDGTNWSVWDLTNSPLPSLWVFDVAVASDGVAWFATYGGLAKFDGTAWTAYPADPDRYHQGPPAYARALTVGPDGTPWALSPYGLVHFDGSDWTYYDLPTDSEPMSIAADLHGNVWVGTYQEGLAGLSGGLDYPLAGSGRWLDERTWEGTYDFTSLVQRGKYAVSVGGAMGLGGMAVPTDGRFTFTVDYPGSISDSTPPPAPNLYVSGVASDPSAVYARWSAADPESGITLYRYAIGSAPGAADIVGWTETTETSLSQAGLGLVPGTRYWLTVRAGNAGNLWSDITYMAFTAGQVSPGDVYLPLAAK